MLQKTRGGGTAAPHGAQPGPSPPAAPPHFGGSAPGVGGGEPGVFPRNQQRYPGSVCVWGGSPAPASRHPARAFSHPQRGREEFRDDYCVESRCAHLPQQHPSFRRRSGSAGTLAHAVWLQAAEHRTPALPAPLPAPQPRVGNTPGTDATGRILRRDGGSCCRSLTRSQHLPQGSLRSSSDPPTRPRTPSHPHGQRVPAASQSWGLPVSIPGPRGRLGGWPWGWAPPLRALPRCRSPGRGTAYGGSAGRTWGRWWSCRSSSPCGEGTALGHPPAPAPVPPVSVPSICPPATLVPHCRAQREASIAGACRTCGRRRSSRCRPKCGCRRGRARRPPCRAHRRSLSPGTAGAGAGKRSQWCPVGNLPALPHMHTALAPREPRRGSGLTSQSSLMCLAKRVWISVREQLRRPASISIRSCSEYISSFSTKCCRSCSYRRTARHRHPPGPSTPGVSPQVPVRPLVWGLTCSSSRASIASLQVMK